MSMCSIELPMNTMKLFLWTPANTNSVFNTFISRFMTDYFVFCLFIIRVLILFTPSLVCTLPSAAVNPVNIPAVGLIKDYFMDWLQKHTLIRNINHLFKDIIKRFTHCSFRWTTRRWAARGRCSRRGCRGAPARSAAAPGAAGRSGRGRSWNRWRPSGSAAPSAGRRSSARCSAPARGWWRRWWMGGSSTPEGQKKEEYTHASV